MLRLTSLCLASLLALQLPHSTAQNAPLGAPAAAQAGEQALAARLDALIAPLYKADAPGATIIVVRDGKPLFRKAYGMADMAKGQPMSADMSLRLGSITKQFTAVGILMLADEGKLAVGDDMRKYLTDFPDKGKVVTIEHLLTHTSGIPSYTGKKEFGSLMTRDMSVAEAIGFFKDDPLEFDPGTRYAYNNSGYFLLGAIIEKVSGQTYAKFMEQRIFVPLGMTHTAYEGHERGTPARALGHTKGMFSGFKASKPLSMTLPYAAGALVSSVDDLARWDAAISAGQLIKPASWQKAFTPYVLASGKSTGYGYGWQVGKMRGLPEIAHGGSINGFSTYAMRLPEQKLYVAVLSNADSGVAQTETVAYKAAALAIDNPYPENKAAAIDPKLLDNYEGSDKTDDKNTRLAH